MKVKAWTYDVWGNKRDGFDVNDRFSAGEYSIDYRTWESEKALKRFAKSVLGIRSGVWLSSIDIDGDDRTAYFTYAPDGYPLGEIEVIKKY